LNKKIFDVDKAVTLIKSGDTVAISGLISFLCPEKILCAIENRFLSSKEPSQLTILAPIRCGWGENTGLEHLAHKGLIKRIISGSYSSQHQPRLTEMISNNSVEAYAFPFGVLFSLMKEIAAGRVGVITQVGIDTFVDPRKQGGKLNSLTTEDLVKIIKLEHEIFLFYKAFPVNVAIIRGTTSDEEGNISLEQEPVSLGVLDMAMAAKASNGKVIAQVKRITQKKTLHPREVEVPGVLVDAVVLDEKQRQSKFRAYNPSWTGEIREPLEQFQLPLDYRKVILRRALLELQAGDIVNIGVGIPTDLVPLAVEEGIFQDVTFTTEHGVIGGLPMGADLFGAHVNPEVIINSSDIFNFYIGGGLDVAILGFAQVDRVGNVNVSQFSGNLRGPGGFIDITHVTKKILFCGSFTAGDLHATISGGKLSIEQEGKYKKFVKEVEQINFNGERALRKRQQILYITERGVFRLTSGGLELVEIAPGINLQRDILQHLEFDIQICDSLSPMDARIFQAGPMDLKLIRGEK